MTEGSLPMIQMVMQLECVGEAELVRATEDAGEAELAGVENLMRVPVESTGTRTVNGWSA